MKIKDAKEFYRGDARFTGKGLLIIRRLQYDQCAVARVIRQNIGYSFHRKVFILDKVKWNPRLTEHALLENATEEG